jgi:geranylgeranyl diphosphate synthase type II
VTTTTPPADVTAGLRHYADLTRAEIERHLPQTGSTDYLVRPVADYPRRGGKGLRPAICLATCVAFGGTLEDALPSAAALEMLHNAFLIHDDIEDHSDLRRGEPALHHRYGTALAINAGDALALAGAGALRANLDLLGPRLAKRVFEEFDFMSRQTADGQALDLGWRIDNRTDLDPAAYLDLIMKKTCWYTTVLPLRIGALIGSRGRAPLEPMIDFGFYLGAAFQIQDDILNLVGDPDRYGKERLGDLHEGKRTLVLIHLLASADDDERAWLETYLGHDRAERTSGDVAHAFSLIERHGSIEFSRQFAFGVANSAHAAFERAFAHAVDGPERRFMSDLIDYMIERDL